LRDLIKQIKKNSMLCLSIFFLVSFNHKKIWYLIRTCDFNKNIIAMHFLFLFFWKSGILHPAKMKPGIAKSPSMST